MKVIYLHIWLNNILRFFKLHKHSYRTVYSSPLFLINKCTCGHLKFVLRKDLIESVEDCKKYIKNL